MEQSYQLDCPDGFCTLCLSFFNFVLTLLISIPFLFQWISCLLSLNMAFNVVMVTYFAEPVLKYFMSHPICRYGSKEYLEICLMIANTFVISKGKLFNCNLDFVSNEYFTQKTFFTEERQYVWALFCIGLLYLIRVPIIQKLKSITTNFVSFGFKLYFWKTNWHFNLIFRHRKTENRQQTRKRLISR